MGYLGNNYEVVSTESEHVAQPLNRKAHAENKRKEKEKAERSTESESTSLAT